MTGVGHFLVGSTVTYTVLSTLPATDSQTFLTALSIGAVSSLLPDLDSEESILKNQIRRGQRKRSGLLSQLASATLVGILDVFSYIFPHRGTTHYLITPLLLSSALVILAAYFKFPVVYAVGFFVGYTSHILTDSMTVSGIKMFAPFSNKTIHLLPKNFRVRTGSYSVMNLSELIAVFLIVTACVVWLKTVT